MIYNIQPIKKENTGQPSIMSLNSTKQDIAEAKKQTVSRMMRLNS